MTVASILSLKHKINKGNRLFTLNTQAYMSPQSSGSRS